MCATNTMARDSFQELEIAIGLGDHSDMLKVVPTCFKEALWSNDLGACLLNFHPGLTSRRRQVMDVFEDVTGVESAEARLEFLIRISKCISLQ